MKLSNHNETNTIEEVARSLAIQGFSDIEKARWFRIKTIVLIWSEWGDSNSRHLEPKSSALPTGPHPEISTLILEQLG